MKIFLNFVIVVSSLICEINSLRWTKSGYSSNVVTVIETSTAKSNSIIDVSDGVQVTIIKNSDNFAYSIDIYCFISGYNNKSDIDFYFSKDKYFEQIKNGGSRQNIPFSNFKIDLDANDPNLIGMKVGLKFSSEKVDHSGSYYCRVTNGNFAVISNYIEIRDVQYWSMNLFQTIQTTTIQEITEITNSNLPQVLNCSNGQSTLDPSAPRWTKVEFPSPTQWAVCPILKSDKSLSERNRMNPLKCLRYSKNKCPEDLNDEICPRSLKRMSEWGTFVNQNGDLIFTDIRASSSSTIDSYSFLCYAKDKDSNHKALFYFFANGNDKDIAKGISFDAAKSSTVQDLEILSPKVQEFTLYSRQIPKDGDVLSVKPVIIYVLYRASENVRYIWKFGSTQLQQNNNIKLAKYTLTFHREITTEHAGTYTLEIMDRSQQVIMEVMVRVLGPPILVQESCMPLLNYVWAGDDVAIHCEYKQRPQDIKLRINSQEIKLSDDLENSKANLKKNYAYLEMLNFTMSPNSYMETDTVNISYTVFNLTKTLGQTQYQDHSVTFEVHNDFGVSVKSCSIYVVPRLKTIVTSYPDKYNCTDQCSSLQKHEFRCDVKLEDYGNKELRIEHYWTINSHKLGNITGYKESVFTPYFLVDPVTKMLTMLPIKSDNTKRDESVKAFLKDNNIECHVDIYPVNKGESTFEYLSTVDSSLGNRLNARITLDYVPINNAYVYWVMVLLISLLVLVILIVLLTRHCMKNKGETYQLDKLERKHGYDPVKELQEEIFKPYERQEHDPEAMHDTDYDRRLSITGNSIGSNDNGELDSYALDTSNYNEDGSIIGKYSGNPRNRTPMT